MSIKRSRMAFEDNFTQIPNDWLRDPGLSLRARGLLGQLMSHKVGWVVSIESLVRHNPEGRDAIRRALSELKELGYLKVVVKQQPKTGKLAGQDYVLSEPDTVLLKNRTTVQPHYGSPPTKNINYKKINSQKTIQDIKSALFEGRRPIEHSNTMLASEKQIQLLRDSYILATEEIPDEFDLVSWRSMTSAETHDLIQEYWQEVEHREYLDETLTNFAEHLSEEARAFVRKRTAA